MLFTIWSINLFFINNFRLEKLKILIFDWWHCYRSLIFWKFCKYRKCNIRVDLSKFTSNKKILSKVVALSYNKFYCQILFFIKDDLLFLVILACLHKGSRSLNKFLLQKKIIIKNNVHNFVKKWPDIVTQFFFFFFEMGF